MQTAALTDRQRSIRQAVRAFLMTATTAELARELEVSIERGDEFRAACVRELIVEDLIED